METFDDVLAKSREKFHKDSQYSYDVVIIHPGAAHGIYGELGDQLVAVEPPLWTRLLAGYAYDHGHSCMIIDQEAEGLSAVLVAARVFALRPRLVVIAVYGHQPSASTQQMVAAREVAKAIRSTSPAKILMVGGHVSALPEQTLREEPIDYACVGEGPVTMLGLLQGKSLNEIPGLVFSTLKAIRLGQYNVHVNPRAPLIEDLGTLHGDVWHKLPMDKYRSHNWQAFNDLSRRQPYASIFTSLGCAYKCLAGDTLINTIYGKISIKELSKRFGKKGVPVYTLDPETKRTFISDAINIRKYGVDEKLVRVHFDDDTHIDCTPDHQFLQFRWGNGKSEGSQWACEARHLKPGAHVRAVRFSANSKHKRVYVEWGRNSQFRSRMIMEYMLGRSLAKKEHVHHIDHNSMNDHPDNLEYFANAKEHFARHPEVRERMRKNNPSKFVTPEGRERGRKAITGLRRSQEAIENYKKAARKRSDDPIYIDKLRIVAKAREAAKKRRWWTSSVDGKHYRDDKPRCINDFAGRRGFNAHLVNHRVVRVEKLKKRGDVYCMTVPETGWFYANDVLVKNCSFCCINAPFGTNRYRMRNPQDVIAEFVKLYHQYGVKTFKVVDEMFILNERHYTAIAQGLIDRGIADDINIWAYARVDTVKEGHLALLRKAGFRWLALGVESGSAYVRDGASKRLRNDDIAGVVRSIQAAGIHVIANYIFGLPDDTLDSMRETLKLACDLNTEFANFYSAQAYPGSPLYAEAIAKGWTLPESWAGYSQHNKHCRPLDTRHIDAASVLKFRDDAFGIYFSRSAYQDMLAKTFNDEAVKHVKQMLKYPLPRNLLDRTYAPFERVSGH